jgi:hypothetical protein
MADMKAILVLLAAVAVGCGIYYGYMRNLPVTDRGTATTQAISLTGVRSDLLQIAQAERAYIAANGNCAPLSDLLSSNTLGMTRSGREGYAYSVECSGVGDFSVVARHPTPPAGSTVRYPSLSVNQSMQVAETE